MGGAIQAPRNLGRALHEEAERRALDPKRASLEAAWQEAEEVAVCADALPDDPQSTEAEPRRREPL